MESKEFESLKAACNGTSLYLLCSFPNGFSISNCALYLVIGRFERSKLNYVSPRAGRQEYLLTNINIPEIAAIVMIVL
jgi:hypothetical protein